MSPLCDIVVLTWNKLSYTKAFVESLLENTFVPIRVIFIDNGSSDGTREYLVSLKNRETCRFTCVFNEDNKGYVRGNNQGIKLAEAPYVCLANNDLLFTSGWLSEMLEIMDRDRTVGLLSPNSNNLGVHAPEGHSIHDLAKELKQKYSLQMVEQPFCIGFCMLTRREIALSVGGLSEEFIPMFFEDSDFSRKVAEAGYRIGVAQGSYVFHHEHASMDQWGDEKEKIFQNSKKKFESKWGKTLRLAYVSENKESLVKQLPAVVSFVRKGNFATFYVKGVFFENSEDVFKLASLPPLAGIEFISVPHNFNVLWKLTIKKKPFDFVVTDSGFIRRGIKCFRRIPSSHNLSEEAVQSLKFPSRGK